MREELISFDTAKLAKKKGFVLGTGWHGHGDKFYYEGQLTDNFRGDNPCAPTQSLLQRWLREVYNIHIGGEVRWNNFENEEIIYEFWIKDMREVKVSKRIFTEPSYLSYEEALEKGLYEALKLI